MQRRPRRKIKFQTRLFVSRPDVPLWRNLPYQVKHDVRSSLARLLQQQRSVKPLDAGKESDER